MNNPTIHGKTLTTQIPDHLTKSLGEGKGLAGLGGAATDYNADGTIDEMEQYAHDLKQWLVDVMESGQQVSQEDWNQILQYVQYTSQALGGWDPFQELGLSNPMGALSAGGALETGPNANEAQGGFVGVLGNFVYNKGSTHIEFIGSETPHDIYTDEFVLDVPYESANVTVEETTDTRIEPNEQVLKIIVSDPMVGAETVYFVHNFDEADKEITINTADGEANVEFIGDEAALQALVEVKEYSEVSAETVAQSSHEMVEDPNVDGQYSVTGAGPDDVIQLTPQPNGPNDPADPVNNETFLVNGNSVVTVPMDAQSVVVNEGSTHPGFDYTMVVTHADGSTDTFMLKGGSLSNHINALPEMITMGGTAMMDADGNVEDIPDAFEDNFTLYVGAGDASASAGVALVEGDTAPTDITSPDNIDGDRAVYDDPAVTEVSVTANFDDDVTQHYVAGGEKVVINPSSHSDEFIVSKVTDPAYPGYYLIRVTNSEGNVEIFLVDESVEEIVINAHEDKVGFNDHYRHDIPADQQIVMVGGVGGADAVPAEPSPVMNDLMDITGTTPEQMRDALNRAGFSFASEEDMEAAFENGTLPGSDLRKWGEFLYLLDPTLAQAANDIRTQYQKYYDANYQLNEGMAWTTEDWAKVTAATGRAMPQLIELLQASYPNIAPGSITAVNGSDYDWRFNFAGNQWDFFLMLFPENT